MNRTSLRTGLTCLLTSAWFLAATSCGSVDEGPTSNPSDKAAKTEAKPGTKAGAGATEPVDPSQNPQDLLRARRLRNGLAILPVTGGPSEIASIRLTVEAGTPLDPQGKSGLAKLCASCLIDVSKNDERGVALTDRLAELSATLELHMEGRRTGFEISGPRRHLLAMVRILFGLMTGESPSPSLVESQKRRLLHELSQTRDHRLRLWQIQRSLGLNPPTPKEQEQELASLQTASVQLFYSEYYRPQTALLTVEAEGFDDAESKSIDKLLSPWKKWHDLPDPVPLGKPAQINYTPGDGPDAELILILPDPDPAFVGHGAGEVTWQIMTLDGLGGWISERLAAEGFDNLPSRIENHVFDRLRVRCLSYRVEASLAPKLLTTISQAFGVLGTEEPSNTALRVAVRRALLSWDLRMGTPRGRIEALDLAYLASRHEDLDRRVLDSITKIRAQDFPAAAAHWTHPRVLIRGPAEARPPDSRLIPMPLEAARPITVRERVQSLALNPKESAELAAKAYAMAQESIAGTDTLLAFSKVGYEAKGQFVSSIPFTEIWTYDMAKGKAERRRTILSTEIRTFTEKDKESGKVEVVEEVESKRRVLDRGESELFRVESVTQPHALLATMLRQKIQPKLGGRMKSAGRSFLVLDFELFEQKLRLLVDEENGLPRRLVYSEWRPASPQRLVTLLYEAYDKEGRFQLPRRISKYIDGEFKGEFKLTYPRRN